MKQLVLGAFLMAALAMPAHAQVRVGVNIGINLPGPPAFVVAPGTPVYYAPQAPAYVPAPILYVPVRYYRVPPPAWRGWRREAPPRWESHYGRDWREEVHERNWREREDHAARAGGRGCPPGLAKQG